MYKLYCRTYQKTFRLISPLMPWREPDLLEGEGSLQRLPSLIKSKGISRVLVVTDHGIVSAGLLKELLESLQDEGVRFVVYDDTVPNPTIENIEEALEIYHDSACEGIIAFGGGSPMDCAKGVAARIATPKKSVPELKGQFKVRKNIPPFFAVPTTSGTGSEATVAAIISNSKTHEKYAIIDLKLIPHYAVLDPLLTLNLPPHITAATGMDALTHAIEAYVGLSNTKETEKLCKEAVKIIFEDLLEVYSNGENLKARARMQKAAYLAGVAFTRAFVGNVHAIAHTLGGFYGVPHGLANAVILPYVLEYCGEAVHKPLAELADVAGIGNKEDSVEDKANNFIKEIWAMNEKMNIPKKIKGIQEKDIPVMVKRALKEANPLYPVPVIFSNKDMEQMYSIIKE